MLLDGIEEMLAGANSMTPHTTFASISALVCHLRDFVTPVTCLSIANFFKASLAVFCFCGSNSMPELRSHKRGRSLDQRLFSKSEHRFIASTMGVDAIPEAATPPTRAALDRRTERQFIRMITNSNEHPCKY
jgi:hypothetical protein